MPTGPRVPDMVTGSPMGKGQGMPAEEIQQMMADQAKREAGKAIGEGADPAMFGLPGFPEHWGTAVVPDAKLVILTLGTKHGPVSFSLKPEMLEGEEGKPGIIEGFQKALGQAKSGLVVPGGPVVGQPG